MPEPTAAGTSRYYSSRKRPGNLTVGELYLKLYSLFMLFREKDYFKQKAGITKAEFPTTTRREAAIALNFQPFPIEKWTTEEVTEDHVFDTLEFLYDYVSKPGEWGRMTDNDGYNYNDYYDYDEAAGRAEFRDKANSFLADYASRFELTEEGRVLALGEHGLRHILDAEIPPFDEVNVDSKVRHAISK